MKTNVTRLLFACLFLWMAAVPDLRSKRIPLWIPGIFFVTAAAADLLEPRKFEVGAMGRCCAGRTPHYLILNTEREDRRG